jgi:type II secretory pathway component GspD/PulD (secretin)
MKIHLLIALIFASSICGVEPAKMNVEAFDLDMSDFEVSEQLIRSLASKEGLVAPLKDKNRIIVNDYPENIAAMKEALKKVRSPMYNVRVQVKFNNQSSANVNSATVTGGVKVGGVAIENMGKRSSGDIKIQMENAHSTTASLVQQELLVVSGGKAKLRVGHDIPYAEWFWGYGLQHGWWTGQVTWREVGSQLVVEPYVMGTRVRIRLTPEFSYLVDGQTLTTAVEKLTTEVFAESGQEIYLGGLDYGDKEFYSRFLVGSTHLGERRNLQITLRPTIEPIQQIR